MPDDPVDDGAVDADDADHDVPLDLVIAFESIDFAERAALGPNA